ncbi:hypothetical protein ACW4FQ_29865, partial [Escherichia coli]
LPPSETDDQPQACRCRNKSLGLCAIHHKKSSFIYIIPLDNYHQESRIGLVDEAGANQRCVWQ